MQVRVRVRAVRAQVPLGGLAKLKKVDLSGSGVSNRTPMQQAGLVFGEI